MKKMILIISGAIACLLLCAFAYYGGFEKIVIRKDTLGGETIVYKAVTGDYKQTMAVSDEVYNYLLNDLKIETFQGIGIFYDDPKKVSKENLTSEIGCVISTKDITRLKESGCKYQIKTLPVENCITTEFPYKGMPSILIGLVKVYPAIEKYINVNNLTNDSPLIEIYDVPNKKTIYRK